MSSESKEERIARLLREIKNLSADQDSLDDNPFTSTLGKLIQKARLKKGYTKAQLAEIVDVNPNSMAKYERAGEQDGQYPPVPKLALLCMALEIDPREALKETIPFTEVDDDGFLHSKFEKFLATLDMDPGEYESFYNALSGVSGALEERTRWLKDSEQENLMLKREIRKLKGKLRAMEIAKKNGPDG